MKFATKAIHLGYTPDEMTGAIMPPIYMTSTYRQQAPGESTQGYEYTRAQNPNFTILEEILAALENASYATIFSSGLGALTGLISTMSAGDTVLAIEGLYGGTFRLLHDVFTRFGIAFKTLNATLSNLEEEMQKKPKWFVFETPTNPLLTIFDIQKITTLAQKYEVFTLVDNTFATPFFQNPLQWGAHAVWHSTTKYIGGHSDVIGGALITNDATLKEQLTFARKALGLNPSPFDAWLVTRGVKTLALRMERHAHNAQHIALFLASHPLVKKVYYPGLSTHPQHELAKKQMQGFSGIVSVEFHLSLPQVKKLISSLKVFMLAESLGGVESLVCHPATMTHASIPTHIRLAQGLSEGLVRLSVGIEDSKDLIHDLKTSLDLIATTSHLYE